LYIVGVVKISYSVILVFIFVVHVIGQKVILWEKQIVLTGYIMYFYENVSPYGFLFGLKYPKV
jgi:hypothetical protein